MIEYTIEEDAENSLGPPAVSFRTTPEQTEHYEYSNIDTLEIPQIKALNSPDDSRSSFKLSNNVRVINKSQSGDIARGRTMHRISKYPNPLARAESRPRFQRDTAIEVDMRPIKEHVNRRSCSLSRFSNPVDICAILDNNLLEPCHEVRVNAVAEVLTGSPNAVATSTTESLHASVSLGAQLPAEILQQIYCLLSPVDFNSARHICRAWFIRSLEISILNVMLRRGGWSNCAQHDFPTSQAPDPISREKDEWIMSKRIARECTLGPDWTGNGVSKSKAQHSSSKKSGFVHLSTINFTEVPAPHPDTNTSGIIFTPSTCGKFLMAANGCVIYVYELNRRGDANDGSVNCLGTLRPVTSVICPRRVLACSMDTSSRRYAIAVLLDGRMGLVCDISPTHIGPWITSKSSIDSSSHNTIPSPPVASLDIPHDKEGTLKYSSYDSSSSNFVSSHSMSSPHFAFRGIATTVTSAPDEHVWSGSASCFVPQPVTTTVEISRDTFPQLHVLDSKCWTHSILPPSEEKYSVAASMPIEMGSRSLYRNLCSDDDLPRSVAICPQRRCVAFGCSSGIELHWVDALTGQDLNRWFPLTAPSDYLFFLPPRTSIDSAKKLRLISSAARPGERAAISQRVVGRTTRNSPFWDRLANAARAQESDPEVRSDPRLISRTRIATRSRAFAGRIDCSDHYRAVPLSDGYHVLFTDPATGLLCLGSDAPVGGPTKLLRKIWFQGPEGKGSPVAYAGSMDTVSGVRVVAAYGPGSEQSVWFFSVPGDVFAANKGLPFVLGGSYAQGWSQGSSHDNRNANWVDWWPDQGLHEWLHNVQDSIPGALPRTIWPVKIRGQEIGTCPVLVDIMVQSGSSMTVWAFSRDGVAKTWRIDDGKNASVRNVWVTRDGTVGEINGEGNLEIGDTSINPYGHPSEPMIPPQETFDGTTSSTPSKTRSGHQIHMTGLDRHSEHFDSDGDLIMKDVQSSELSPTHQHQEPQQESIEAVAFLYHRQGNLYRSSHRSGHSYESIGTDFVEGLTGVTRIDVEIR